MLHVQADVTQMYNNFLRLTAFEISTKVKTNT